MSISEVGLTRMGARAGSQATGGLLAALRWPVSCILMVAALLAPAAWNGFPFIFADTGGYLARPFEGTLELGRSALYGAFLAPAMPLDFWPSMVAQAALTAWLVVITLRTHGLGGRPGLALLVVLGLAALTSLPWYAGQMMPDIFVPLSVLALHLLAFRRAQLSRPEIVALAAVVAVGIASHMAILALVVGLLAVFSVLRAAAPRFGLPRPRLGAGLAAAAGGVALALLSNLAITGQLAFTPGGSTFFFGRLVQDGIVQRYLDDRCPDPSLTLCAYRTRMPDMADDWLWWDKSPLHQLGGWEAVEPESRRIIQDSFLRYPHLHVLTALKTSLSQLVLLQTGEGINAANNWHAEWKLRDLAPEVMPRFNAAAQQHDRFAFGGINAVHVPVAFAAMIALPFLVMRLRRRRREAAALALTVLVALLGNAAISGIFSNPNPRYQSRIVPLAPLAVVICALSLRRRSPRHARPVPYAPSASAASPPA